MWIVKSTLVPLEFIVTVTIVQSFSGIIAAVETKPESMLSVAIPIAPELSNPITHPISLDGIFVEVPITQVSCDTPYLNIQKLTVKDCEDVTLKSPPLSI